MKPNTFITDVNASKPKELSIGVSVKEVPKATEINELYGGISSVIEQLNDKINNVIQYHEKDFFAAFKNRMYQIKEEMKILKEKASKERLEMKREERMATLQNERDWFRREALELDKMNKDRKKTILKLKNQLDNAEDDCRFFNEQLLKTKKINKSLVFELERYTRALPRSENATGALPTPYEVQNSSRSSKKDISISETRRRKINDDLYQRLDDEDFELPLKSNDVNEIKAIMDGKNSPVIEENEFDGSTEIKAIEYKPFKSMQSKTIDIASKNQEDEFQYSDDYIKEILEENQRLKSNEIKYQEIINSLKSKLQNQKRKTTEANFNKVNYYAEKSDLEDFFLN